MRSTPAPKPISTPRGRPRSLDAKQAILNSARELVEKGGYNAATIEAIAARSGVAKTTIYRWWPNRNALLVDLLVELANVVAPPPSGQDPVQALRTELLLVGQASDMLPGRLLSSLLGEAECDTEVQAALQREIFIPRRKATAAVVREAQLSGAIRSDIAPKLAVDLFFGPLFYRRYVRHEPVPPAYVKELFKQVLFGLRPQARRK